MKNSTSSACGNCACHSGDMACVSASAACPCSEFPYSCHHLCDPRPACLLSALPAVQKRLIAATHPFLQPIFFLTLFNPHTDTSDPPTYAF